MARNEARDSDPATDGVCFHCQQAVEKMFKAWLVWHEQPYPLTHNIAAVEAACEKIDPEFAQLRPAAKLSPYAATVRYGDEADYPSMAEMREALALASRVEAFVLSKFASLGIDPRKPEG